MGELIPFRTQTVHHKRVARKVPPSVYVDADNRVVLDLGSMVKPRIKLTLSADAAVTWASEITAAASLAIVRRFRKARKP